MKYILILLSVISLCLADNDPIKKCKKCKVRLFSSYDLNLVRWKFTEKSEKYPFVIFYKRKSDREVAQQVKGYLEKSWRVQIKELGFRSPIPYNEEGKYLCVYLNRKGDTAVTGVQPTQNKNIWWDAYETTIGIDAWGDYAGDILDSTTTHEFNHTLHAAYDWFEAGGIFETSATFIQEKVFPEDNDYLKQIAEFQQYPSWPIDRNDQYKTWFMYGASLYLFFLEENYFKQDRKFLSKIWNGSRNRPRPTNPKTGYPDPESNEPDWIDALESLLPKDKKYTDTVVEFARWRFYMGRYDDGKHFHDSHLAGEEAEVFIAKHIEKIPAKYESKGPMLLGSEYIQIEKPTDRDRITIDFQGDSEINWVLQAVPGILPGSDGELVDLVNNPSIDFGKLKNRVLIVTACPNNKEYDPDTRSDKTYKFQLRLK